MSTPEKFEFIDLSLDYSAELLDRFYNEVYLPAFPIEGEREELVSWKRQLTRPRRGGGPEFALIIAGRELKSENPTIAGGTVLEYYLASNVGLLTYLVVDPAFRGKNLSRLLLKKQLDAVDRAAEKHFPGRKPYAYFSEMNDPALPESHQDKQDPDQRFCILSRLGFHMLDFPYVQPRLHGRRGRYHGLKFLVHEHTWSRFEERGVVEDREPSNAIRAGTLKNFIEEFYREVEGKHPDPARDPDYAGMMEFLNSTLVLEAAGVPRGTPTIPGG